MLRKILKSKKGQGLAEYAVILVAVTVVCLTAISVLGHNIGDLLGVTAAILPGSEVGYDQPVYVGELIELAGTDIGAAEIVMNVQEIADRITGDIERLDANISNNRFPGAYADLVAENAPQP